MGVLCVCDCEVIVACVRAASWVSTGVASGMARDNRGGGGGIITIEWLEAVVPKLAQGFLRSEEGEQQTGTTFEGTGGTGGRENNRRVCRNSSAYL